MPPKTKSLWNVPFTLLCSPYLQECLLEPPVDPTGAVASVEELARNHLPAVVDGQALVGGRKKVGRGEQREGAGLR